MSRLIVTNVETQNIKFDSDTTAFTIASDGTTSGAGAGAMVKLLDVSNISSVATYDIDSTYINSTYDSYMFIGNFLPATDEATLYLRTFVGGTINTSAHHGREGQRLGGAYSSGGFNSNSTSSFAQFNTAGAGNADGEGVQVHGTVMNVNNTSFPCTCTVHTNFAYTDAAPNASIGSGMYLPAQRATVINGLRFFFGSGNIASGTLKLYGFK